ncbi:hypothetical protein BF49_1945 [Bradyrhizobium sp.]|nr:hypothetical protein BF49_1945 [Bradyrhizobium sp.]
MSGKNPGKCGCDENVNIKSDEFIRKRRQPCVVATGVAIFDMNVHAVNPTEIAEPLEECVYFQIPRWREEKANSRSSLRLLCSRCQRQRRRHTNQSQEFSSFHYQSNLIHPG